MVFRTLGEFKSLKDIKDTIINFWGNDVPVTIGQVGDVKRLAFPDHRLGE